jgi:hypothetical protein
VSDYPLRWQREGENLHSTDRSHHRHSWVVEIPGWWLSAAANSREEALSRLQSAIDACRMSGLHPRPGTRVTQRCAPSTLLTGVEEIAREFCPPILAREWEHCFFTYSSSVWDYAHIESDFEIAQQVLATLGVDLAAIPDGNLLQIFQEARRAQEVDIEE